MSVEASEEEGSDILLLVRSWIGDPGGEMCFVMWVKFAALFGSAPEVVASIVKRNGELFRKKGAASSWVYVVQRSGISRELVEFK